MGDLPDVPSLVARIRPRHAAGPDRRFRRVPQWRLWRPSPRDHRGDRRRWRRGVRRSVNPIASSPSRSRLPDGLDARGCDRPWHGAAASSGASGSGWRANRYHDDFKDAWFVGFSSSVVAAFGSASISRRPSPRSLRIAICAAGLVRFHAPRRGRDRRSSSKRRPACMRTTLPVSYQVRSKAARPMSSI